MKSLWIALCILFLLAATLIGNCIFINQSALQIEAALRTLPEEGTGEALQKLKLYWEGRRTAISISVAFDEIRNMDELIETLCLQAQDGRREEFEETRALALLAAERLRRLERFCAECII